MSTQKKMLKYNKAIINIIYSFTWDISECDFGDIVESSSKSKKWEKLFLFERPVDFLDLSKQAAYHPNIISQNLLVLQRHEKIDENVEIIVPLEKDDENKVNIEKIITQLSYTIRIYENGSGNCSFAFNILDPTYYKITALLRLSSSIVIENSENNSNLKTSSFIKINNNLQKYLKVEALEIDLIKLFDSILSNGIFPEIWINKNLWYDKKTINNRNNCFNNWQTPYALSIIELEEKAYKDFENNQKKKVVKEIGAIACRLSSENEHISSEYLKLKREYIYNSLGYYKCQFDKEKKDGFRMKNYSHHSDLFYTIGKRAAIAITPNINSNPSYYVCPTLLNLIEILRSRWHLGSIVNLKLDDLLEIISNPNINLDKMQDEVFNCRLLFGLFLKDPSPYLFDGGAITEIAEAGESIFWIKRLSVEMEKKLTVIDRLLDDLYSRKRFNEIFK